ncbi:MAG: hypothetical protein JJU28_14945 [Cyclobacteriaceae bacterium]|nr:hypothetical protein [Cyclobacteriaceae bacterium]
MGNFIMSLVFCTLITSGLQAQSNRVDSITYALYKNTSWNELIETSKAAFQSGIDYYYLRMRVGIAYYEKKNYASASHQFEKALEFNSADVVAKEYLYYSYLLSAREMAARRLLKTMPVSLYNKVKNSSRSKLRNLSISVSKQFPATAGTISEFTPPDINGEDGVLVLPNSMVVLQTGLSHYLGASSFLEHNVSFLNRNNFSYSELNNDSYIFEDLNVSQFLYQLSSEIYINNNWYLRPSASYINVRIPYVYQVQLPGRMGAARNMIGHFSEHQYSIQMGLGVKSGILRPEASIAYSKFNNNPYLQKNVSITAFPTGNLNLYLFSRISHQSHINIERQRWIWLQELGFKVLDGVWLEIRGVFGEMENFADHGATLAFNDLGILRKQYGLSLRLPFKNASREFSLHYKYAEQENYFYSDRNHLPISGSGITFNHHTLTGSWIWKF